jgi:multiple sugar transport system permease protein
VATAVADGRTGTRRFALPRWLAGDSPLPWLLPTVAMLVGFGLYPLGYSVWLSLHKQNVYTRQLQYVGGQQWYDALHDGRMWHALEITLIYTGVCLVVEVVLGMAIALLLDADRRGYGIMRALMALPLVVPPAVTGMMFLLMEDAQFGVLSYYGAQLGIVNPADPVLADPRTALVGVMIADVWQWTPFMILIFLAGLRALPKEPFEAAAIDGASAWQAFRHLTLPMLGRVIAVAVLIRSIDLFRVYDYVYIMTGGGPGTTTETLSFYAGKVFGLANFALAATLSLITLVALNAVALAFTKIARVRF